MKILLFLLASTQLFAQTQGFKTPRFVPDSWSSRIRIQNVDFELKRERIEGADAASTDSLRYRVPVGKISQARFNEIAALFKTETKRPFDANKFYYLEDFLRPIMKAVEGKQYQSVSVSSPELAKWIKTLPSDVYAEPTFKYVTNCWQTAIEVLRNNPSQLGIYYPSSADAAKLFRNKQYFTKLASAAETRFGDIVYIDNFDPRAGVDEAVHAAFHVGGGLYFEKTGSGDHHLYRFVPLTQIRADYPQYTLQFLRPTGKAMPLASSFSVASTDKELARELGPVASKLSVEVSSGQGMVEYEFIGIGSAKIGP